MSDVDNRLQDLGRGLRSLLIGLLGLTTHSTEGRRPLTSQEQACTRPESPTRVGPKLQLSDIQGDVLEGLQKNSENFIFFKILDVPAFKTAMKAKVVRLITSAAVVHQRELINQQRQRQLTPVTEKWPGLNVSFTKDGLTQLLGATRPQLVVQKNGTDDNAFELGAADLTVTAKLNDAAPTTWLAQFTSDRVDGVFLVTGPDAEFVADHGKQLIDAIGTSVAVVYSEIGNVRPNAAKGHEHFGFLDGISQPGVRGLTKCSNPTIAPDQGLPGQDLIWPGEFVFGYSGQDPNDGTKEGNPPTLSVGWAANSSFMVFRRLQQFVPEFNAFVEEQANSLGTPPGALSIPPELLASRLVGRWRSGAPLALAPLRDDPAMAADDTKNNNFGWGGEDPFQRTCPYAAHIRKTNPRSDFSGGNRAPVGTHRIIRAGIPFGPEVAQNEVVTRQSRGLMFVCYQTSIAGQFEFLQSSWAGASGFVFGKTRPGVVPPVAVEPGIDPIIGQAAGGRERTMDEPLPNYPTGSIRSQLNMPQQFVVLTAAVYCWVPSLTALQTVLT
jgi:Dyp-type peroxidase family